MAQIKTKKQDILRAALTLASLQGWDEVCLDQIAIKAGVSKIELGDIFTDKSDIVRSVLQGIDDDLMRADLRFDLEYDTAKDRIFEVLMYRFDLLNKDRAALVSMLSPLMMAPEMAWLYKNDFCHSMRLALEKADMTPSSMLREDVQITALSVVYMLAVKTWLEDDTADMSKTMAVLDKHLSKMFKFSSLLDGVFERKTLWSDG